MVGAITIELAETHERRLIEFLTHDIVTSNVSDDENDRDWKPLCHTIVTSRTGVMLGDSGREKRRR
ncbi:MAG TPA: hypothetical protein VHV31_09775 [Nitrolancea sp.]|jgi:hypothetical protein|nr:hypothetical protein [Nitrolancea sp.]